MKTFKLSIFKGHELKHEKEVVVNSKEELKAEKMDFGVNRLIKSLIKIGWE